MPKHRANIVRAQKDWAAFPPPQSDCLMPSVAVNAPVLGSAVAAAGDNSALSGAMSSGGAEAAAPLISHYLYGEKDGSKLTAEQKETVAAITGLLGVASGAAVGSNATDAVQGGLNAEGAVENNALSYYTGEKNKSEKELKSACISNGIFSWNNNCQNVYQKWMKQSASNANASTNPKDWQSHANQVANHFQEARNICNGNVQCLSIISVMQLETIVATYGNKIYVAEIVDNTLTGYFSVRQLANNAESAALAYMRQWANLSQHGYETVEAELPGRNKHSSIDRLGAKKSSKKKVDDATTVKDNEITRTEHGYKHNPQKNTSWRDTVRSTLNGPAKFKHGINKAQLERQVWEEGIQVTNGKTWKVKQFDEVIGAKNGKESKWMRSEFTQGVIHGHPITEEEYKRLIKPPKTTKSKK